MIERGTILQDRFLIEEQIGVGGMGAVYRAVDQKFGTYVAIKETFYNDPTLAEAFEREARLLNGLHHPLFPHVSDHFVEGSGHFLVMEYIEGEDISALLKRGERFSVETVMRWTLELLDGIDYLHSQDPPIIHRDVKPSNLRLTPRGNLVLLDFGMAKETSGDAQGMRSVFGYSRRYSPLEQIEGTGTDVRSDIFSLGATIYHLLTGTAPVDVLARASSFVAGRADPLKLASEVNSDVPEAIAAVIHSTLALDPDKRFVSSRAVWKAIEEAMNAEHKVEALAGETPVPPTTKDFPALAAFEKDAEMNYTVGSRSDRQTVPNRMKIRRSGLIAALAILVLGLFGYGLYQLVGPTAGEAIDQQAIESEPPATEVSEISDKAVESSPEVIGIESELKTPEVDSRDITAERAKTVNEIRKDHSKGEQMDDAKRTAVQTGSKDNATSAARSAAQSRSRTTDAASDRRAPVSSIESILTGMPDRTGQQRQWEIWHEEELRRRRIRRQIRRGLPY